MASGRRQYPFDLIEPKWQRHWAEQQTFRAWNPGERVPADHPLARRHAPARPEQLPKFYILDMFPYPSGAGLHVGHPEGYTATDILARYRRACGYHVLHPMGWDAFGLPAEQYALKTGQHPRQTTEANIANFKRQIKALGFSYDWSREIDTTDPRYFKWTQWIFLKLYHSWFNPATGKAEPIETLPYPPELSGGAGATAAGLEAKRRAYRDSQRLAYVSEAPVWWCEQLGTVLANEEVLDGKSEVGGFPVVRKPMRQWMLRITAYAQRLLQDLDTLEWSDSLKEMQRNWIGRSEGAEVPFTVQHDSQTPAQHRVIPGPFVLAVFTTRPDTLFGATYMVLAPEHGFLDLWLAQGLVPGQWPPGTPTAWTAGAATPRAALEHYRQFAASKSDLERTELAKEKTGVFTGVYAINPVNRQRIPIWIADYVLASYGTGAIMAVPGHDTRDLEFARKFHLPIVQVVQPPQGLDWPGYLDDGIAVNSANSEVSLNGLATPEAKRVITAWLEARQLGSSAGSVTGANPFPSFGKPGPMGSPATRPCPNPPCRSCSRNWPTTNPHPTASRPWPAHRPGSICPTARNAKPTPCPNGPAVAGITSATWMPKTTSAWSIRPPKNTGWGRPALPPPRPRPEALKTTALRKSRPTICRRSSCLRQALTSTLAAPSTPCCTCSTRASGTRCFSTSAASPPPSLSLSSSTRVSFSGKWSSPPLPSPTAARAASRICARSKKRLRLRADRWSVSTSRPTKSSSAGESPRTK
jgi:hypothetical protein